MLVTFQLEAERRDFMHSLETHDATPHQIHCSNIFEEVMTLFSEPRIMCEYPLRISFVGEQAVDTGGVLQDMLSAFWEEAYLKHFDGAGLLTPIIHAQIDLSALPILEVFCLMATLSQDTYHCVLHFRPLLACC